MYKSDLLTYSRFTRTLTTDEGLRVLRGTSEVTALKVPSSSDQSSPSFPKAIPLIPKVLISKPVLPSDQLSPSHPKVGSLVWGDLASDGRPSGVLAFLR